MKNVSAGNQAQVTAVERQYSRAELLMLVDTFSLLNLVLFRIFVSGVQGYRVFASGQKKRLLTYRISKVPIILNQYCAIFKLISDICFLINSYQSNAIDEKQVLYS